MLYEIKKLKKTYDGRNVLDLDHLELERQKIIGLLGPNGAGKTTLLEILAFLLAPSKGSVRYKGRLVDYRSTGQVKLRQEVVLVQQQPILFSTSVSKNVEFPLKLRKFPRGEREKIVRELLALVGMEEFRDYRANRLSGGETQRVAIAQALACSPGVILLDEPTASVDVENQIAIEHIIRQINHEKGISVIFTTHDRVQASRVADEMVFLFDGKRASTIYENIFSGRVERENDGRYYFVTQNGIKLPVRGERSGWVKAFINPEQICINKTEPSPRENKYEGRLLQITDEKEKIRFLVDVGMPLSVLVQKEDFSELEFGIGEALWVSIPAEAIGVI